MSDPLISRPIPQSGGWQGRLKRGADALGVLALLGLGMQLGCAITKNRWVRAAVLLVVCALIAGWLIAKRSWGE